MSTVDLIFLRLWLSVFVEISVVNVADHEAQAVNEDKVEGCIKVYLHAEGMCSTGFYSSEQDRNGRAQEVCTGGSGGSNIRHGKGSVKLALALLPSCSFLSPCSSAS